VSRPTSPQFVATDQGDWSWTWRCQEGMEPFTVEHEYELEWLREVERWQVRSRYDRAGWTDPLIVDLPDPESQAHADQLVRDYAAEPRGG
jgi:hypothetical protein